MTVKRGTKRGTPDRNNTAFKNGAKIVKEALADRAGRGDRSYLTLPRFKNDAMSVVRHVKLVDGRGRPIMRTLERSFTVRTNLGEDQRRHERGVARRLLVWCIKRGLPPFIELLNWRDAARFLRELAARGLARRTMDNYRSVLSRLWEYVADSDAEFLRHTKFPKIWERSSPLENPWKNIAIPPPKAKVISHRTKRSTRDASTQLGLLRGPLATAKQADQLALRLRSIIKGIRSKGITSKRGIARALNEMGEPTPRGKVWDATAVRRVEGRIRQLAEYRALRNLS